MNTSQQLTKNKKFKIFIGGLKSCTTAKELLKYFKLIYPEILRVEVPLKFPNTKKQRNKGFAIVHTRSYEDYKQILDQKKFLYQGRKLAARQFLRGSNLKDSQAKKIEKRVFLTGLLQSLSLSKLKSHLESNFGKVEDIFKLKHPFTKEEKDCGYCFFVNKNSAQRALKLKTIGFEGFTIRMNVFEKREDSEDTQPTQKNEKKNNCQKKDSSGFFEDIVNNHSVKPTNSFYYDMDKMWIIRKVKTQATEKQMEIFNLKKKTLKGAVLRNFKTKIDYLYGKVLQG